MRRECGAPTWGADGLVGEVRAVTQRAAPASYYSQFTMQLAPMRRIAVLAGASLLALSGRALSQDRPERIPIAVAIEDRNGDATPDHMRQKVSVRGVTVIGSGIVTEDRLQVYIQDETAGLYLFDRRPPARPVRAGDVVEATGFVDQYRGSVQLVRPEYRIVGRQAVPRPLRMTIDEASQWQQYGKLVEVEGTVGSPRDEGPNLSIPLQDGRSRIKLLILPPAERSLSFESMPSGSRVRAQGVVSIYELNRPYNDGFRLLVADGRWIQVVSRPMPKWVRIAAIAAVAGVALILGFFLVRREIRAREKNRERHVAVLNALSGTVATRMSDVDSLLSDAVEILARYDLVGGAVVHLIDGRQLRLQGAYGVDKENARAIDEQIQNRVGQSVPPRLSSGTTAALAPVVDATRRAHPLLCIPLQGRSRTVGVLTVFVAQRRGPTPAEAATIAAAANLIALGIENVEALEQAEQRQEELKQLAITDPLTGLYNRRFLDEYLRIHLPMARRQSAPVSFIAMDLDHFKAINDKYGHDAGDALLSEVGKSIRKVTRASDLPVRVGGEEFLVVMPDTNESGAMVFANRLLNELRVTEHQLDSARIPIRVTASFGVAVFPDHGESVRQLLRVADEALYESKRAGRDRITVAPAPFRLTEGGSVERTSSPDLEIAEELNDRRSE